MIKKILTLSSAAVALAILGMPLAANGAPTQANTIPITEANFAQAETAKNFRNWAARGANKGITHMRNLPPRGDAAPTIQMNDDTLYSVVITEADKAGMVTFTIPQNKTQTLGCTGVWHRLSCCTGACFNFNFALKKYSPKRG